MSCIIYTAKLPWLYDLVVREATAPMDHPAGVYENGEMFYDEYLLQDAAAWEANAVYRRYAGGEPYLHFVLCYENKVVIFQPDREPTEAQMLSAGRIFQK